jgi:flagellar hook assembly protein FlgD
MVPPEREDPFFIDPGTFSPDNDGIEDVLNIRYRFSTPGNMVSILIFDSMGRLVKTLINNTLAGTEGVFSWDGSLDRVSIGSDGIYIIFARVFTLSGNTEEYKNVCVLRSRRDQ